MNFLQIFKKNCKKNTEISIRSDEFSLQNCKYFPPKAKCPGNKITKFHTILKVLSTQHKIYNLNECNSGFQSALNYQCNWFCIKLLYKKYDYVSNTIRLCWIALKQNYSSQANQKLRTLITQHTYCRRSVKSLYVIAGPSAWVCYHPCRVNMSCYFWFMFRGQIISLVLIKNLTCYSGEWWP